MPQIKSFRDLTLIETDSDHTFVIACDSLGAIGSKEADYLKTTANIVGRCTVRVPLLEVVAAGAKPLAIVNTLSVEMEPTGRAILSGIREELAASGFPDIVITGSTEENVPTRETGVGITVIGEAKTTALRLGKARAGDTVYCLGKPRVGYEVLGAVVPDVPLVNKLLEEEWIHEILPVGSRGVLYEAGQLAAGAGGELQLRADEDLDIRKSAGPATSLLLAAEDERAADLRELSGLEVYRVGSIISGASR
jgi:hypothetical protein